MANGKFVISLDFELQWGVRDKKTIEEYRNNIIGVHTAIPKLLDYFHKFNINATFATVGFLFFKTKKELLANIPELLPNYTDKNLSPYNGHFNLISEEKDEYHFANSLIQLIQQYPSQEISSHTFSHYYCLEQGQTIAEFRQDTQAAIKIAKENNVEISSLVFPRNQFNKDYLSICAELGIICIRGNEKSWLYEARNSNSESKFRRAIRLLDAYLNISGHHTYSINEIEKKIPINIPASRFLRPYSAKLKIFEYFRLKRILNSMTYAAKNNRIYHLWWHPHNFGINQEENFAFLEKILIHFDKLKNEYDFQSITMSDLAKNKIMML